MASEAFDERLRGLNASLSACWPVHRLAAACGLQPWVVAAAGVLWVLGFLLWGFTGELVGIFMAHLYPMYASFRALEAEEAEKVTEWLTYWVTFGAFSLLEPVCYRLLAVIPFYHLLRLVFIIWLYLPATRGAQTVYEWVIGPVLRRYQPGIEVALDRSAAELRRSLGGRDLDLRATIAKGVGSAALSAVAYGKSQGLDDVVAQELAKAAARAVQLGRVTDTPTPVRSEASIGNSAAGTPAASGARARMASPRPSPLAPSASSGANGVEQPLLRTPMPSAAEVY